MNKHVWFLEFQKRYDKFKWFLEAYFGDAYHDKLKEAIANKNITEIYSLLNSAWFYLPDSSFNIVVNPEGWSEFIWLLEESPKG